MADEYSEDIVGYRVTSASTDACIARMLDWISSGAKHKYFVCANPHSFEVAKTDAWFNEALRNADLLVPDGIGIIIASRLLGGDIRERITGSDIFLRLSMEMNARGGSYFFLGSGIEQLETISSRIQRDFPNIKVAGIYSPPYKEDFSEEDDRRMVDAVNLAKPDVLWVGMTAPKQEKWIYRNVKQLDVKLLGPVGAVFDFYSGKVKRPSPIFQNMGLEWLPRLVREPRRLWRRNLVSNPKFLFRVIKDAIEKA